jgi:hypothetical protein
MAVAIIQFTDTPEGTLEIKCEHTGEYDEKLMSHRALHAVGRMLPIIFDPVTGNIPAGEPLPEQELQA